MNSKWIIFAFVSLSVSLTSYGLPETEDGITPNSTATKQWRVFQFKTTASSVSKTGTTTTRKMTTTTKRPPTGTTKRSGQLIAGSSTKTPTTIKRSGQQALGSAGRTSTTTKRSSTLKNSSGPTGKSSTTTAKSMQPRTLPPVTAPSGYKTSTTTTKARGVPEKIKQRTTTRRVSTTTARNAVHSTYPVLLRSRPPIAALMSSNNFFYGTLLAERMFSPFGMYPSNTEGSANSTTDSSNMTTTMDPVSSTTTVTALTTTPTLNNTTTSNDTVEYEEHEEVLPTPAEYDYLNESDTTTPAVSVPVTETTHNVTSSIGPNMIRKRRKKVISTTTPSPNPGVVRIRLRRKKTTIAPVTDVTTVD